MKDFGIVPPGTTLYIEFDSFASATGASITLTGLLASDIEVYKDGSVTQRASDSGYALLDTDGIDFDLLTGIHGLSIDLADNTTAGFWAAGSHYRVVISAVTVDSQTVSFTAATFRIGYTAAILNTTIATLATQTSFTLTSGPAEDDALNGCVVLIHDVASAVQKGFAVVSDYTGATKTVTLTAGTTFTAAATDNISLFPPVNVTHIGATAQTANDNGADINEILTDTGTTLDGKLNTIDDFLDTEIAAILAAVDTEVATIITDVAAVKADTAAILLDTGTDGVVVNAASLAADAATEIAAAVWAVANIAPTAIPAATATMKQAMSYWLHVSITTHEVSATEHRVRDTGDTATVATHLHSDAAGVFQSDTGT